MYWRGYGGDLFAGFVLFLVIVGCLGILFWTILPILLWIFLGIGGAVGLCYSLYIYIRCFISAARGLGSYSARNTFLTMLLRWFELYKDTSVSAFKENLTVAGAALTRAHMYRFISPKKWVWLIVAPAVLIIGTLLIIGVILLQGVLLVAAVGLAIGLVLLLCVIMFLIAFGYAIVATAKNMPAATSRGGNIFTCFEFTLSTRFPDFFRGMGRYFVTMWSYFAGIISENFELGVSNGRMASGYRVFSPVRYFLYFSLAALLLAGVLWGMILMVFFLVLFPFMALANCFWALIATILHK